ncbi:MAG TPA: PilZ domain-containing protein [Turneriella sp.]|nr:PilZ domain-containing protein [Turneriella sp.]
MATSSLADSQFFIFGESKIVADALEGYLTARKASVHFIHHFDEIKTSDETDNILIAHYNEVKNLAEKLGQLKKKYASFRILLLHEFIDRGKISQPILSITDHLLEKPFSRLSLDKALEQFRFKPLTGKKVLSLSWGGDTLTAKLLATLGATVYNTLPKSSEAASVELIVITPIELGDSFRADLSAIREVYADVPIFMIYDPEAPGVLNSTILNEVAYLLQQPVQRQVLRAKILDFFEQPQRDRRKNPRKKNINQVWISAYNAELKTPELFESPALIDVSQSGLSFQSYTEYRENQAMTVWVVAEDNPDKILDLRAVIVWRRKDGNDDCFKYGIEFTKENPQVYDIFARMIAMHLG